MKRNSLGVYLISGFIFFGHYFDSTLKDLELREVKYRAGIHLDFKTFDGGPVVFVEDETLMRDHNANMGFFPVQTNFKVGLSQKWNDFEAILMNECRHPVDGTSNGSRVQDYTLIELRYNFK